MRRALVFGGSGQIGRPLLQRLHDARWRIDAVSRMTRDDQPGVHWLRGDFEQVDGLPMQVDAIFNCGPLDRFARWYAATDIGAPRVIAFGSTSIQVKQMSADVGERDLARRLHEGETGVFAAAAARGAQATLLRPTLVYGAGRDRTLSRIAALARRWGRFPLPRDACGLRQPVHVDDLAAAALGVCDVTATHARAYALPGGDTLPYREMIARVLAALNPPTRLLEMPVPLFRTMLATAHALGVARDFNDAALERMHEDLVFDLVPAQQDFGYAPRVFRPTIDMFSGGD